MNATNAIGEEISKQRGDSRSNVGTLGDKCGITENLRHELRPEFVCPHVAMFPRGRVSKSRKGGDNNVKRILRFSAESHGVGEHGNNLEHLGE